MKLQNDTAVYTGPKEQESRLLSDSEHGSVVSLGDDIQEVAEELNGLSNRSLSKNRYLNREFSWIKFNRRVLFEATHLRTPLLERVKFLAIVSANIDEFYMKRLGGLKLQIYKGLAQSSIDGRTPEVQLEQCRLILKSLQMEEESVYRKIHKRLAQNNIDLCSYSALSSIEKSAMQKYFQKNIRSLIMPVLVEHSQPFPFIENLSLNIFVTYRHQDGSCVRHALIKIPTGNGVPRFIRVGEGNKFVRLEELIIQQLGSVFPNDELVSCDLFRITRNAIVETDDSDNVNKLVSVISELQNRQFAPVVRLQIGKSMRLAQKRSLITYLGLEGGNDVFECSALVDMSDLMEIATLDIPTLRDTPHSPVDNAIVNSTTSVFEAIRQSESILLQHPYESFGSTVEKFVRESCRDNSVESIKMTLYRTSAKTKILGYLIEAAKQGKHVTVIIELKARFDEEANLRWAAALEQAGVNVSYGIKNLKTHCKAILITRNEKEGLFRYAHVGTGNYHAGTARLYSDLGLLSCKKQLTEDLENLFNYLTTGIASFCRKTQILTRPFFIKNALLEKIHREISLHSTDSPGLIRLKTNALEDQDVIDALYRASCAGVKVELIVRDICRLRPGVVRMSENISVISIVGRFLEHSRVYYFRNNGNAEFYMGSADLMTRNLERRVELLVPIDNVEARDAINQMLENQLRDTYSAWEMQSDGHYVHRYSPEQSTSINCQEISILNAQNRNLELKDSPQKKAGAIPKEWLRLCF